MKERTSLDLKSKSFLKWKEIDNTINESELIFYLHGITPNDIILKRSHFEGRLLKMLYIT